MEYSYKRIYWRWQRKIKRSKNSGSRVEKIPGERPQLIEIKGSEKRMAM